MGGMLTMGRTGCCSYTVRSYDETGHTLWRANYWAGSNGTFSASVGGDGLGFARVTDSLHVATGSDGNVYVAGPAATSLLTGESYSLICYSASGVEQWRKNIKSAIAAAFFAIRTGNVWDVCVLDDGRIVVLTDSPLPYLYLLAFNPDGSTAIAPDAARFWLYDVRRLVAVGDQPVCTPLGFSLLGGSNVLDNNEAGASRQGRLLHGPGAWGLDVAYPTIVQNAVQPVVIQTGVLAVPLTLPAEYWRDNGSGPMFDWGFRAASPGAPQTISTSPDESLVYVCDSKVRRIIPDTGVEAGSAEVWSVNETNHQASVGITGGVVMGGSSIKAFAESDGSKLWAHNHQQVTDLDRTAAGGIVSVGELQFSRDDRNFV